MGILYLYCAPSLISGLTSLRYSYINTGVFPFQIMVSATTRSGKPKFIASGMGRSFSPFNTFPAFSNNSSGWTMTSQGALAARANVCAKIEELLSSLRGIRKARVEMDGARISRVTISPSENLSDRQITRNVTSALQAAFGYQMDGNDVVVDDDMFERLAPVALPATVVRALPATVRALPAIFAKPPVVASVPVRAPASVAPATVLLKDGVAESQTSLTLSELSITSLQGDRLRCRAVLTGALGVTIGEVETVEAQRMESIARAVIVAARAQLGNAVLELDAIRVMDSAEHKVVLALVRHRETHDAPHRLAGAEMIGENIDLAAAKATVAALNRISIHE
jgi:hypothetical protein